MMRFATSGLISKDLVACLALLNLCPRRLSTYLAARVVERLTFSGIARIRCKGFVMPRTFPKVSTGTSTSVFFYEQTRWIREGSPVKDRPRNLGVHYSTTTSSF